jgi:hypothetical protein
MLYPVYIIYKSFVVGKIGLEVTCKGALGRLTEVVTNLLDPKHNYSVYRDITVPIPVIFYCSDNVTLRIRPSGEFL